jgi:hypothetical protein
LLPLSTTFVHILAQREGLSKGKFQQILEKARVLREGLKNYNLAGRKPGNLLYMGLPWLVPGLPVVLVKRTKFRLAG